MIENNQDLFNFAVPAEEPIDLGFGSNNEYPVNIKENKTQAANKEIANIVAKTTDSDLADVEKQMAEGDSAALLNKSNQIIGQEQYQESLVSLEGDIAGMSDPQDIAQALKNFNEVFTKREGRPPTLAEQRAYVANVYLPSLPKAPEGQTGTLSPITQNVVRNNILSMEAAKRSQEFAQSVSFGKSMLDMAEMFLPNATVSEEYNKNVAVNIYDNLDKLATLPADKQLDFVHTLLDRVVETETFLIDNNNSVMISGQLDTLVKAIAQGAALQVEGATEAEVKSVMESAFNGTIFLGEFLGAAASITKLSRFLMRRIHSAKTLNIVETEQAKMVDLLTNEAALRSQDLRQPNYVLKGEDSEVIIHRENLNLSDTLYLFDPREQVKAAKEVANREGDLAAATASLVNETGMSTTDVAERLIMTPSSTTDVGWRNLGDKSLIDDFLNVDLPPISKNKADETIAKNLGRELSRPLGTTLKPIFSGTAFDSNDIDGSLGTFTYLLGDNQKAFKSAEKAQEAVDASGLGYSSKVVSKDDGFYVEMKVDHYINPLIDTRPLEIANPTPTAVASSILNDARLLEEDFIRSLYAITDVNRSTVQKLEERGKEAFRGLNVNETEMLMMILAKGDHDQKEWATLSGLHKDMEIRAPESVWKAYKDIRKLHDEIYQIREANYYNKLRAGGNKYVTVGEETVIGAPVKTDSVKNVDVIDAATGKAVSGKKIGSGVVVKLGAPREVDRGKFLTHMLVQPDAIKPLQRGRTLSKLDGHIDRTYKDANWIVSVSKTRNIDGKDVTKPEVKNLVQTEAQAMKVKAELEEQGFEVLEPRRTRENDEDSALLTGLDNPRFGYGASHLKQRGEQLGGAKSNSLAEIYNPAESLFMSINGLQKALDYNALEAVRIKFNKGFAEHLENGANTPFSTDLNFMFKRDENGIPIKPRDEKVVREMVNHHNYMKMLLDNQNSAVYKKIDSLISWLRVGKYANVETKKVAQATTKLATENYIVWNALYQLEANLLPAMYTLATGGWAGAKAFAMAFTLKKSSKGRPKALAKLLGGDEELATRLITEIENNGLVDAVGRSDDFMDLARNAKQGANTKRDVVEVVASAVTVPYGVARKGLTATQQSTIKYSNLLAYLTEFNVAVKAGKKMDGAALADVNLKTRLRTQTQNSLDKFSFQSAESPLSPFLQFFQQVYKFTLDTVIEPQWEVLRKTINPVAEKVLKKQFGSLGKNTGRISDSYGKAFMAALTTWVAFGPEGALGRNFGSMLEDSIRGADSSSEGVSEPMDAFLDGVINYLLNESLQGLGLDVELDINPSFSPAAGIDMLGSLLGEGVGAPIGLYATGTAFGSVYNIGQAIEASWNSGAMTSWDMAKVIGSEIGRNFKMLNNAEKAYVSYWSGRHASSRTFASDLPVNTDEWLGMMFNIRDEASSEYYYRTRFSSASTNLGDTAKDVKSGKAEAIANLGWTRRAYAREIAGIIQKYENQGESADLSKRFPEMLTALQKWVGVAKFASADEHHDYIESVFRKSSLVYGEADPEVYLLPYIENRPYGDKSAGFRIAEQKLSNLNENNDGFLTENRKTAEMLEGK